MSSMTGYSRAVSQQIDGLQMNVEIQSVNRKMLDIQVYLPKELFFLEIDLRKLISKVIGRGQVTVKVSWKKEKVAEAPPVLKKLKTHWEKIAKELGFPKENVNFSFLVAQMEKTSFEEQTLDEKKVGVELTKTVEKALHDLIKMRKTEGKQLCLDIKKRLQNLSESVEIFEKYSQKSGEKYREKILEKIRAIQPQLTEDERIMREVAIFAEKVDITEEITRLKSHFQQANDLLKGKEESMGRTLDFLTQEILRELNTIAAKSAEIEITKQTVAAKAELEKMREQIQNIE